MKRKYTFDGKVTDGKLRVYDEAAFRSAYKQFEGQPVFLSIEKATRTRSNPQNAYLWGVVYKMIADETGYEPETIHEMMRARFLIRGSDIMDKATGAIERFEYVGSTTKLTTEQFSEYVDRISIWAQDFLNLSIPLPGQTDNA